MHTFTSSIDRPIQLRTRADLLATPVEGAGASSWVVKDPLTLEHYQFSEEEYALLDWLRAPRSIAQLQRLFQHKFSPQTIAPQAIWEFVSRLHEAGLVVGESSGQGRELRERRTREQIRRTAASWTGILGIRFRGIDPDPFLAALHDGLRWLFSPVALAMAVVIVLYALSIVCGQFAEFHSRLPEISALMDWRNLPWLLLAIGSVKILHELGHALTCKHFGGEVHELGLLLLVFVPCLYCDVSDAWRLSKWRRIAVTAAGVGVELFLAALATIVWWHAQPGIVQLVALNVMLICTLNTLLINGNPLMRYDGYYLLSDLVEVPNLWQRSREAFRHFWSEWLLGQPQTADPLLPARQRPWLAAYAVLSKTYLVIVCVVIVFGLAKTLAPYRLQNLAYVVGLTVLGGALIGPVTRAANLVRNPARRASVRRGRLAIVAAAGLAILVAVLALPVNYNISAPVVLLPEDAARVYAAVDGTLQEMLPAGSRIARGDTVATLENSDTNLELARLEGECRLRQLRVEHLERLRGIDPEANNQLLTARTALADSRRRLEERRNESLRLTLTSPVDGVVLPAPRVPAADKYDGKLPKWTGSLLDPVTRGAHVAAGTLACLVGDPNRLSAVLLVDDAGVKFLEPGERARVRIAQLPGQILTGEVVEVARHESTDSKRGQQAAPGDLSTLMTGLIAPGHDGPHYEVRVRLDEPPSMPLIVGGRGDAKVATERITLARRLWRSLAEAFRLPM